MISTSFLTQDFDVNKMNRLFDAIEFNYLGMGSLSIHHEGKEFYQKSIGFENVEKKVKSTANTRYRIGSITKPLMAAAIMQMIEEGKLDLHTKLSEYYPDFENADQITIEHLLRHRSGLFNFTNDPAYNSYMQLPQSQEALLRKMMVNKNTFLPGKQFEYSNTGYVLLSFIAEKLDKKSFAQLMLDRISTPLGLENTYVGGKIGAKENEAQSYQSGDGWTQSTETHMSIPMGAGGVVSTPNDVNKFFHALFSGTVIKPSSLELMRSMQDGYGLGIHEMPFRDKKGFGHGGSIDKFSSSAGHFASDKITICYVSNGSAWEVNQLMIGALSIFYGNDYEIPNFESMALPLLISTFGDSPQVISRIEKLLDSGANIDAQNTEGETAIILAGWLTSNLDLIKYLVEQGADLNIANNNGDTPLIDAAYLGKNEILKHLLDYGADISLKNKNGLSALDMAQRNENTEAIKLLVSRSEDNTGD